MTINPRLGQGADLSRPAINLGDVEGNPGRIKSDRTRVDGVRDDGVTGPAMVDDLLPAGSHDQVVLDRRDTEVIGKFFAGVDRLCGG